MKIINGIDIPIDGLAVSLATFILSPPETRVRNTIAIALIHGTLHPIEVHHELNDNHSHAVAALGPYGDHRKTHVVMPTIHGSPGIVAERPRHHELNFPAHAHHMYHFDWHSKARNVILN
jgi:hypothetical protein